MHHLVKLKLGLGALTMLLPSWLVANPHSKKRPNILWILLEDTAPLMSCYGNNSIQTPNIDRLANEGITFTNMFMSAPVSSACRSSLITGMMPTSIAVHNHHSSRTEESAIYLPEHVQTIPEIFTEHGYFCFNNGKDDYNFMYDRKDLYDQDYYQHPVYGKSGERIDLAELKGKEPFFGQIQLYGGKEIFSSKFKERVKDPVSRDSLQLPPYLPNHPAIVEEYANHLDAIQITDDRVGEIMKKLEEEGLLENIIVFFFSDHGMRLTRNKQFLYDGGIHVPFIIADYTQDVDLKPGNRRTDLVSGIDIGPTSLGLCKIETPGYMEGQDIFADEYTEKDYVISARDRCDFSIDRIRSVRTKRFKYIRNFMTDRPYMQPSYMDVDGVEFVRVMKELYADGKLDEAQARFMSDERPTEELYDLENDPYELINLAEDSEYAEALIKHREILNAWIKETDDQGQYPESEEGLKFMYGIWGKHATNPEYDVLRKKYPELEGALFPLKSAKWEKISK